MHICLDSHVHFSASLSVSLPCCLLFSCFFFVDWLFWAPALNWCDAKAPWQLPQKIALKHPSRRNSCLKFCRIGTSDSVAFVVRCYHCCHCLFGALFFSMLAGLHTHASFQLLLFGKHNSVCILTKYTFVLYVRSENHLKLPDYHDSNKCLRFYMANAGLSILNMKQQNERLSCIHFISPQLLCALYSYRPMVKFIKTQKNVELN